MCGAPQYVQCVKGHSVWTTQATCPTCGARVSPQVTDRSFSFPLHDANLSADKQAKVNGLLRPGESLLWCGSPDPTVRFTKADLYIVPFSILWTAFALFAVASAVTGSGPLGLLVLGIPFLCLGAYITVGRFLAKARQKRRTLYVLTDQRAVVAVGSNELSQSPWLGFPEQVYRHRDKRHVDVVFQFPSTPALRWPGGSAQIANTGMDFFARGQLGIGFYDVADGHALLAAMGQAA